MSSRPSCSIPHNPRRIGPQRLARPSLSALELVVESIAQDRVRLDALQNLALPRLRKVVLGQAEGRRHCPYQARTRRLVILSPQRTRKVRRTELDLRRERSERQTALSKDMRELFGEWTVRAAGIALALAKRTGGARSRRRLPLTHAQKGAMTGARLPSGHPRRDPGSCSSGHRERARPRVPRPALEPRQGRPLCCAPSAPSLGSVKIVTNRSQG
jgi:hypothetical protein